MQLSPTTNVMAGPQWVEFKKKKRAFYQHSDFLVGGAAGYCFSNNCLRRYIRFSASRGVSSSGSRDESASNTGCAIVSKRPVCTGTSGAPRLGAATGDESLEISRNESVDEPSSSRVSCSCARCSTSVGIPASLATCKP